MVKFLKFLDVYSETGKGNLVVMPINPQTRIEFKETETQNWTVLEITFKTPHESTTLYIQRVNKTFVNDFLKEFFSKTSNYNITKYLFDFDKFIQDRFSKETEVELEI